LVATPVIAEVPVFEMMPEASACLRLADADVLPG